MVKYIELNAQELLHRERAHRYLAEMLEFPNYYGKNLDALFDCLTELGDCTLLLREAAVLRDSDGYGARVLRVLEEAAQVNPHLRLETGPVREYETGISEDLPWDLPEY